MCGIAGFVGEVNDSRLGDMLSAMTHRGPDDEGKFIDEKHKISMGARRLSIVDLSNGGQPISNEDGSVTVVFNGEIYNYDELKVDLEAKGHKFKTDCDTEVLVHLWEEYGKNMSIHLNGMFVFSIWDKDEESLFISRDRLGIKPLFIYESEKDFMWASEIKSLLSAGIDTSVDRQSLYRYFSFRFTPNPDTLLDSVRKLPPGHSLLVTDSGITQHQYWELSYDRTEASLDSVASQIRDLLETSVEDRLMGDVPVGAFLSGGLDSSAIVGLMANKINDLKTFSIGFNDGSVDESEEARFVAEEYGTDHTEVTVDLSSMDMFTQVVRRYGEPLADPAILPTLLLSEKASDHTKVVLTGEGADELFGGYKRYRRISNHQPLVGGFPNQAFTLLNSLENHAGPYRKYLRYVESLQDPQKATIESGRDYEAPPEQYFSEMEGDNFEDIVTAIDSTEVVKNIERFDIKFGLPDKLLYKVDHATMAMSLEARVPYLDHRLVELAFNIPKRTKLDAGEYKPVLRRAVKDIVPDRTLNRDKHGFIIPVGKWFRENHDGIEGWLSEENINRTPYINQKEVFDRWEEHRRRKSDHRMFLWKSLNYVAWYNTHLI